MPLKLPTELNGFGRGVYWLKYTEAEVEAIVHDCAKVEEQLHIAICQAVTLLNGGDSPNKANRILREALTEYQSTLERYGLTEPDNGKEG